MLKKSRLVLSVILMASLPVAVAHSKAANSCVSSFHYENKQIPGNFVAIPGGIKHGRMHDQLSAEDCWAQAITELVESHIFSKSGLSVKLSPEYDLFWHVYLQVRSHIRKFETMREQYQDPDPTVQTQKLQKLYQEAYGLGSSRRLNTNLGFQIDIGAEATEAISKLSFTGVVPQIKYNQVVSTDKKETRLENGLAHFAGNYLLKGDNLKKYSAAYDDKDGVNTALFNDLVTSLMSHERAITQVPLRPDQEFKYRGKITTPRNFLKDNFDSKDYRYLKTNKQNQKAALRSIAKSIREYGIPVLIGIELFGDDDVWMKEQNQGLFSDATCAHDCTVVSGQHELLVTNYLFKDDPLVPTFLIVQNSWGRIGNRDSNGNKTRNPKKMGYYLISLEYLDRDERRGPWDLLINKIVSSKVGRPQ